MKKNKSKDRVTPALKIDLACGENKQTGFLGVDFKQLLGVDLVHNLEVFPWPWKNDSVDEIYCCHYIEHTPDLIKFMDECHRILKTGGKATMIAPYYSSMRAWQDPTHRRAISEASFLYFNREWMKQNKLTHYGIKSDFDFYYSYMVSPEFATRSDEVRAFAIQHYINVVTDIQVVLTKRQA